MDEATAARLVAINRSFYGRFFAAFDETRTAPWPGWHRVLDGGVPTKTLDLGCGNGRFARFLAPYVRSRAGDAAIYEGWDDNESLLLRARQKVEKSFSCAFRRVDLLQDRWPSPTADLVVAFGLLHHVPGFARRRLLLERALARVSAGGRLAVCFWQFAPDGEPRVATAPWAEAGIETDAVEADDYLVRWRRGGDGLRYCHHVGPSEVDRLIDGLDAAPIDRFLSDGRSGDLNLYVVLKRRTSTR